MLIFSFRIIYRRTETSWDEAYPEIVRNFADVEIGELFKELRQVALENRRFIVLLVDEITKFYHGSESYETSNRQEVFDPRFKAFTA